MAKSYGDSTRRIQSCLLAIKEEWETADEGRREALKNALFAEAEQRFMREARKRLRSRGNQKARRGAAAMDTVDVVNQGLERIFRQTDVISEIRGTERWTDPHHFIGVVIKHMNWALQEAIRQNHRDEKRISQYARDNKNAANAGAYSDEQSDDANWFQFLAESLDRLDPDDRRVFELLHFQQTGEDVALQENVVLERKRRREEVAEILQRTPKYVTNHYQKAKEQLLALYQEWLDEQAG